MHGASDLLVGLLAACGLTLAGCAGPALLKESKPIDTAQPLAEGRDPRILASIEAVIFRNGPGSWARDAEWDEYLIRVHALSDEPVEIREIAIFDALDHRIESRKDRAQLVDGTLEIRQRYEQSGMSVMPRGTNGLVFAGGSAIGAAAIIGSTAAPGFAGMATVAAAAAVAVSAGAVLVGAGVVRLVNNSQVGGEIERRGTSLPVALPRGGEATLDLFFPLAPRSGRAQLVYTDGSGEHRLDIDTRQAFEDAQPSPPVLVSRVDPEFPDQARRAGVRKGHVKARLTLDGQGRVLGVDVIESVPLGLFDQEARRTLRWWKYSQGGFDGRTVEATLEFRR